MKFGDALVPALDDLASTKFEFERLFFHTAVEYSSVEQFTGIVDSNLCSSRHIFTRAFLRNFDVKSIGIDRFFWFNFLFFVGIAEVLKFFLLVWNDCLVAGMPVSRANFAINVSKLERLDESKSFIDGSSHGVIVDLHRSNLTSRVLDEKSAKGGSVHLIISIFYKHSVVMTNLF